MEKYYVYLCGDDYLCTEENFACGPFDTHREAVKNADKCRKETGEDYYISSDAPGTRVEESLNEAEVTEPFDSPDNQRLRHLMKNKTLLRTNQDWGLARKHNISDINRVGGMNHGDPKNPIRVTFKGDGGHYTEIPYDKIDKVNVVDMANKNLERRRNNTWTGPKYGKDYSQDDEKGFLYNAWGDNYDGRYEEDPVGRYHRDKHQANIDHLKDGKELKAELDRVRNLKQNRVSNESYETSADRRRKEDGMPGKYLKNLFKD